MKNKLLKILVVMLVFVIGLTNVQAQEGLFKLDAYNDIYKLSEQSDKIDLPFINVFAKAATYDELVKHSGISIGQSVIDIDEKLEGIQIIGSNDMVNIKGEVENAIIYGNNVVVEGKITRDSIIIAPYVQILKEAVIEKDVIIIANNLKLEGLVKGNVIATISEKATILGKIQNDLRMISPDVVFENENINGDIYLETDADMSAVVEKYKHAIIEPMILEDEDTIDWMGIITKGIITVIIYSVICFLITRKENNIAQRAYKKIMPNAAFGLIMSVVLMLLVIILPILLIVLAICGLGLISWPILIAYVGLMLLVGTTSSLIVGMIVFEALKDKVGKFKIPCIALIYTVLYTLTKITYISLYANMAILLIAMAIVIIMLVKKLPKEEKITQE